MDQFLGVLLDLGNNPSAMTAINILAPVLLGALLFWMIGKGIAGGAARARKRHDVAMHAADTLAQLYGEVAAGGTSASATAEALTLQLCSGRTLGKPDMAALQGIRQLVLAPGASEAGMERAKFNEHALHLSRVLAGSGPNPLPPAKLAQKQWQDATGSKPAAPAKKAEPAPAKKPEPKPAPVAAPAAPAPVAAVAAPAAPSPATVVTAVEKA